MLLVFQMHLLKAGDVKSNLEIDEDYEGEEDNLTTTTIEPNSTDHHQNCTFNGTVYFDEECTEWMRNFYVILTLTIIGMVGFIVSVLYCSKKFCYNNSGDFERLVESHN